MSLVGAIQFLNSEVGDLSGIKSAPTSPPEAANAFPFSICYPASGQLEAEFAGAKKELHIIYLEIHFNRSNLPNAVSLMIPYIPLVSDILILNPTLSDNVDTIVATSEQKIIYNVLAVEYADVPTLCLQFQVNVKIRSAVV